MILTPQAVIDDTGSEPQSPIFILAGFVTSAERWAAFSVEWQAALDESPGLEYFKMSQAARLQEQFDRKKGWNEAKRDDRLITLARIIRKYAEVRVHASVQNDAFEKYIKSVPVPERKLGVDSPYILVFMQIILAMATTSSLLGGVAPCDFIFDEQGAFSQEALAWWPEFKRTLDAASKSDLPRQVGSPPIFRDDKQFLPLQASDFSEAIRASREGWQQGAAKSYTKFSVRPPSQFEKNVTTGLYLGWGFLFLVFVLWILA